MIYNPNFVAAPTDKGRINITNTNVPIILFHHTDDIDRFTEDYVENMYGTRYSEHDYITILLRSEPGVYTVNKKYEIRNLVGKMDTLYIRVFDMPRYSKNNKGYIAWGVWGAEDVVKL